MEQIFSVLSALVEERATDLIDDILTRRALDFFEKEAPELVAAVIPNIISVTQLTEVLRGLTRERVSIRHFDMIMQAIAEAGPKAANERVLLEEVRIALKHIIRHRFASVEGKIPAIVLEPGLDVALTRCEREQQPLDVDLVQFIDDAQRRVVNSEAVIVVSKGSRRLLLECLRLRGSSRVVLAHEEIGDEYVLEVVGRVQVEDS